MSDLTLLFWVLLGLVLYPYLGFPLGLWILSRIPALASFKQLPTLPSDVTWPQVDFLVAAYNEEAVIEAKIKNFLALDYPPDKLTLSVGSDGSSDQTNVLVTAHASERIRLLALPRTGKAGVMNALLAQTDAAIVVCSDANSMFEPDAIKRLVCRFQDARVGCVCGRLKLVHSAVDTGEGFYWSFETWLKTMESGLGLVMGANGAIYALRRSLARPLAAETINDDFTLSMAVYAEDQHIVYAADAVATENAAPSLRAELRRHLRDGAGHYIALWALAPLLYRLQRPLFFWVFWSHRILRWLAPLFMLACMLLCLVLSSNDTIFRVLAALQMLVLALLLWVHGQVLAEKPFPGLLRVPYFFVAINACLLLGLWRVLRGQQSNRWESTQR